MHPKETTIAGEVTDIFAHRFVVETDAGRTLADLGPKGAEAVTLTVGERVELVGEMKPSELKVSRLTRPGQDPITVDHDKPKPKPGDEHKPHDKPHEKPAAKIA